MVQIMSKLPYAVVGGALTERGLPRRADHKADRERVGKRAGAELAVIQQLVPGCGLQQRMHRKEKKREKEQNMCAGL